MSDSPLVSIIIPTFNKSNYISQTLESVIKQTYLNWEAIVVDDCSTDETQIIIKSLHLANPKITYFFSDVNKGGNYCRNTGLRKASGKYVMFLDGDDLITQTCLENRVEYMEAQSDMDFSVFPLNCFRKETGDIPFYQWKKSNDPLKAFLISVFPWQTMQPMFKYTFLKTTNGYDENLLRLQDVDFFTSILLLPAVKYSQIEGPADCFYRIDDKRRSIKELQILTFHVHAANRYYLKYKDKIASVGYGRYIPGIIIHPINLITNAFKAQLINQKELKAISAMLYSTTVFTSLSACKKFILYLLFKSKLKVDQRVKRILRLTRLLFLN